ncbi:MAG: glycosyltransferase [Bryobacteraceae bacterium]|nr:glycosyltransferase [Bryobacteraceae bacterium]
MKLSILAPVFNERTVVERSLSKVIAAHLPEQMEREVIIVDDCSTDGTAAILERIAGANDCVRLFRHPENRGKGAAVRTAIQHATGDFCIIQDADLEYDPDEYPSLLRPLLDGHADAVFGSRYMVSAQRRALPFWHSMINKGLTLLCNMFCNLNLTDMETGYKAFRTDLLKSIPIRSNRFGIEPEITMKCAKRKLRVYEVPISYHGRSYEEGKKIGWRDGVKALVVVLKFWLIDDLYVEPYGRGVLNNITGTPQYVSWMTRLLRPYLGDRVLEIGAGLGTFSGRLMARRLRYVAAEADHLYLHALNNRFLRTPNVSVIPLDPSDPAQIAAIPEAFDTALCLNVLEYMERPCDTLVSLARVVAAGGRLIVLVPQGPWLYGTVDRNMGHKRRFRVHDLRGMIERAGLEVERVHHINKISIMAWLPGKLLRRKRISKPVLKIFDKTVWLWKLLDPLLPWPGLSLIVVARKSAAGAPSPSGLEETATPAGARTG